MQRARYLGFALILSSAFVLTSAAAAQTIQSLGVVSDLRSAKLSSSGRYVATHVRTQATGGAIVVLDRESATTQTYTSLQLRPSDFPATAEVAELIGISDDGRYLSFTSSPGTGFEQAFLRFDRVSNTLNVVFPRTPVSFYRGPGASVSRDGQVFSWVDSTGNVSRRRVGQASVVVGRTCIIETGTYSDRTPCGHTAMNADGSKVAFVAPVVPEPPGYMHRGDAGSIEAVVGIFDAATGQKSYFPEVRVPVFGTALSMSPDGTFVGVPRRAEPGVPEGHSIIDLASRRVENFAWGTSLLARAGAFIVLNGTIYDRVAGRSYLQPAPYSVTDITPTLRFALLTKATDEHGAFELAVADYDSDNDGMFDLWEVAFGLSSSNGADAAADTDGDGLSNVQEFAARSHPTALNSAKRLFAEGAGGTFFDTQVSVFNPGDVPVEAVVRFLGADGKSASRQMRLAAKGRADVASCCVPTLTSTEFGISVESTGPVVADRTMTWDRVTGYGSHATTGAPGASTAWYFAEGATIAGFQTFYLLSNPGSADVTATLSYLLSTGSTVQRTHLVPAGGRLTVWANQEGAPLDRAEFSATVTATGPIVAERAMYRGGVSGAFTAGTDSIGVTETSATWHFAEGSTGLVFDTFFLVANPGDVAGVVTARYGLPDGSVVLKEYPIAAHSRLTIWADQEDFLLANTAFSTTLTSSVPTVAERAMWWPGSGSSWTEGHTEAGATAPAKSWASAGGQVGPAADTFFLVLNASPTDSTTLTVSVHGGITLSRQVVAPAGSRTTLWMRDLFPELNGTFSTTITSSTAPIIVERAVYTNSFAAGTALRATPLP